MAEPQASPRQLLAGRHRHPFRRAVLRGLGLLLPPLLTILLFVWVGRSILTNVLIPLEGAASEVILWWEYDALDEVPAGLPPELVERTGGGQIARFQRGESWYVPLSDGTWIRESVRDQVRRKPGKLALHSASAPQYYEQYVRSIWLPPHIVLPVFLVGFVAVLYLLGKFLAAGVGRMLWNSLEGLIHRLPIIRNVYSSVKQVTDFVFSEQEIQFHRVVAVEYPRKGLWSIGFVTGESMLTIHQAAGEPVVTVFVPTSPMPATGFTVNIPKGEVVDLDISLDQAIQYIVSCGVVIPGHQQPARLRPAGQEGAIGTGEPGRGERNGRSSSSSTASEPPQTRQPENSPPRFLLADTFVADALGAETSPGGSSAANKETEGR